MVKKIILRGNCYTEQRNLAPLYDLLWKAGFEAAFSGHAEWPQRHNYNYVSDPLSGDCIVLNAVHVGENAYIGIEARKRGKKVVFVPAAFDSLFALMRDFISCPMTDTFDVACLAAKSEEAAFSEKYGSDRYRLTGMPRLDLLSRAMERRQETVLIPVLYTGQKESLRLTQHEAETYWIADAAVTKDVVTEEHTRAFWRDLRVMLPPKTDVVYKVHPEHAIESIPAEYAKNNWVVPDDGDPMYDLLVRCKGVISSCSFWLVEAGIVGKPHISWPPRKKEAIDAMQGKWPLWGLYDFESAGCTFADIRVTDEQRRLADDFLHDGQNSQRVVDVIKSIL